MTVAFESPNPKTDRRPRSANSCGEARATAAHVRGTRPCGFRDFCPLIPVRRRERHVHVPNRYRRTTVLRLLFSPSTSFAGNSWGQFFGAFPWPFPLLFRCNMEPTNPLVVSFGSGWADVHGGAEGRADAAGHLRLAEHQLHASGEGESRSVLRPSWRRMVPRTPAPLITPHQESVGRVEPP